MNIDIPKITRTVALADYAEELKPNLVHVWVNPPKDMIRGFSALQERADKANAGIQAANAEDTEALKALMTELAAVGDGFAEFYAELWSQGSDVATHWTADEVKKLAAHPTDPALYQWLTGRTWVKINEHRLASRKN